MAGISILSWNIEHFNGSGGIDKTNKDARLDRVDRVADVLAEEDPDVFGISEVEGKIVYDKFVEKLTGYTFHITEGRQSQEILIGAKSSLTTFFTQRNEFKRSNPFLRPGAMLAIRKGGKDLAVLFTHLKSMTSPEGFGLRDAMFDKAFNLKKKLDKKERDAGGGLANYIVVGDMNTMGMDYEGKQHDIPSDEEIRIVTNRFRRRKMRSPTKSHPFTFFNGSTSTLPPSNLDHVFSANHLTFKTDGAGAEVQVGGWAKEDTPAKKDKWIKEFSDHAPLTFTVEGF